jgi:tricorn protease-like protein
MNIYKFDDEILNSIKTWLKQNPDIFDSTIPFSEGDNFWTGKKHTDDTKKLLSQLNSGENNPMFGKKLTTEQRLKITQKQTGRPLSDSHKQSISKAKTGIPRSEETKRKISEGRRKSKLQA